MGVPPSNPGRVVQDTLFARAADVWPMLLSTVHVTAAVVVTMHAVLGRRDVPAAIGWIGLAWLAPIIGSLVYLAFGINRLQRAAQVLAYPPIVMRPPVTPRDRLAGFRRGDNSGTEVVAAADAFAIDHPVLTALNARPELRGLMRLGESVTGNPLIPGNRIAPLVDGDDAYPAMLAAITSANRSIALLSYIFDADRVGRTFIDALVAARARGVEVRVLVDDVGSRYSRPTICSLLEEVGVRAAAFLPTRTASVLRYANLRNHRKLLVVDGRVAFTGGMNIREGHRLSLDPPSPVRCLHFVIEGPIIADMFRVFALDWAFTTGETLSGDAWAIDATPRGEVVMRGVPNGPDADIENMPEMLLGALASARERVRIMTPYFLPDARIRSALRVAAMRGVLVDIILPSRNNIPLMDWATTPQLEELLEVGCHFWRTPAPFDHTKLFVIDGLWSLIGSTNWDPRSLRLNFEYNIECYDQRLASQLEALAESRIVGAHREELSALHDRSFLVKLRDGVARLLSPYL